ncbi:hypothetical protein RDABS01_005816 [Bienertia sinuspersici]
MEKEQRDGNVVVKGRATIDTRPPFRSVKEAVALFGERVLVGEIYAKQLKEMQATSKGAISEKDTTTTSTSTLGVVSAELEEAKQNLQKTREESNYMANCIKSLKQELEETKKELRNLKHAKNVAKEQPKIGINPEIEQLKFVEINHGNKDSDYYYHQHGFEKKKVVTFASPPSLTREIKESRSLNNERVGSSKLGRASSFKKEGKNKNGGSIMEWFFPKKKRSYEG